MQWAPTSACERTRETGAWGGGGGVYRARKGAQPLRNGAPCSQPQISPAQRWGDAGKTEKKKKKYFCLFLLLPLLKADEAADPFPAGSCPGAQPVTPHPLRGPPPASPLRNSRISLPYAPPLLFSSFFFFFPQSLPLFTPGPSEIRIHLPITASLQPEHPSSLRCQPWDTQGPLPQLCVGGKAPPKAGEKLAEGSVPGSGGRRWAPASRSPRKSQFNPRLPSKRKGFGPMALQIFKPRTVPGLGKGGNDIFPKNSEKAAALRRHKHSIPSLTTAPGGSPPTPGMV